MTQFLEVKCMKQKLTKLTMTETDLFGHLQHFLAIYIECEIPEDYYCI